MRVDNLWCVEGGGGILVLVVGIENMVCCVGFFYGCENVVVGSLGLIDC